MTPAPQGRWSFSLRTLFVVVAAFACLLGYELNFIRQRHALRKSIEQGGGRVEVFVRPRPIEILHASYHLSYRQIHGPEPEIPDWRRWLGDEPINRILLPTGSSEADSEQAKLLFPESEVDVRQVIPAGSNFF